VIGDEAFPLSQNLMRPYSRNNLSIEKRIFNYRLSRARRYVECSFGILTSKWRIFHRPLDVELDFAIDIVKACCVLHNSVRDRDGCTFEDTLYTCSTLEEIPHDRSRSTRSSMEYRELFTDYFVGEGQIPWQNKYA
jgi:hypothetical protein